VPPEPDEHGDPPDLPLADLDDVELGELVLVPGSEPVPTERLLIAEPAGPGGGVGGGLCWSFDVDLDAIQAAAAKASAAGMLPGLATARQHGGAALSPATVPGGVLLPDEGGLGLDVAAEFLPGSAGLAAWLDQRDPAETSDYDLPAVVAGWRRVAAWAQAREFAAVAQIAARSAARNDKVGLAEDGRPAAITPDAAGQVALALALSPGTGEWWTGQAVTLTWRLPGTGAALGAGEIDAYRARLIIEATGLLDEETARRVEDDVLPGAGELTYAQLRARLRKAVIMADPEGAEERRRASERRARVSLYPDDDGTATLTGTSLPAPHAAAAMARITALARALKASGAGGGTDLLRAHIFIGLLLGTLPPIPPPADGGQPDEPTDDYDQPPDGGPGGPGGPPGDGHPGSTPFRRGRPGGMPPGGGQHPAPPRGNRPSRRDRSPGSPAPHCDEPAGAAAGGLPSDAPSPWGPRGGAEADAKAPPPGSSRGDAEAPPPDRGPPGACPPGANPAGPGMPADSLSGDDGSVRDPWPELPPLTDADAPDPGEGCADPQPEPFDDDRLRYGEDPLDLPDTGPTPAWPPVPGTTGTSPLIMTGAGGKDSPGGTDGSGTVSAAGAGGLGRAGGADGTGLGGASGSAGGTGDSGLGRAAGSGAGASVASGPVSPVRPVSGMLDLTLSWATLTGFSSAPGILGRVGPVTATQARVLAATASLAPGTPWRVILTDDAGHAVKTATVTRRLTSADQNRAARGHQASGPALPLAGPHASLTGRVSVTIPVAALDRISAAALAGPTTRAAILRAAARAAAKIRRHAAADQETDAGCAHTAASPAYRPPPTIRDLVEARDQTCRFPGCRQPAWRGDLDHTTPFHCGGLTCPCNLGPLCRRHHRLKQERHWALTQTRPGTFRWQSPAGRSYATTAHQHSP
jgi:hypothetical protein